MRFLPVDKAIEWAKEHGMDEDDIPTSPESRQALQHPPDLADTDPAPPKKGNEP
jgi:hypothetical protein